MARDREQAISHTKALLTSFTCRYDNIVDSVSTPLSFSVGCGIYGIVFRLTNHNQIGMTAAGGLVVVVLS